MRQPGNKALLRMKNNLHKATVFEQEHLRLPNGDYIPDAIERLHQFWKQFGLNVVLEKTGIGDVLVVAHLSCLEDLS